mgnify:CR=1 FL=1
MLWFSHYEQLIQAAVAGQGIALGRFPLVKDLLADSRLCVPFSGTRDSNRAYFAFATGAPRAGVGHFIVWLSRTARQEFEQILQTVIVASAKEMSQAGRNRLADYGPQQGNQR